MKSIKFIHIGKCAGNTVKRVLEDKGIKFDSVHLKKAVYDCNYSYIIVIRNPIDRFVSAFNWRKYLLSEGNREKNKGEKYIFQNFKTASEFAETLCEPTGPVLMKNYGIHHVDENINFYLGNFLNEYEKNKNQHKVDVKVITVEQISNDVSRLLNSCLTYHVHNNNESNYSKVLSSKAIKNLKLYFKNDFDCINKLFQLKLITRQQYDALIVREY